MNNAANLLEKTLLLRKMNEENSRKLHELGIDLNDLPPDVRSTIGNYVSIQEETGLHDLSITNLEVWLINKKIETFSLQQDTLRPLQRKLRNLNSEMDNEKQKIHALNDSIEYFKNCVISEEDAKKELETLEQSITKLEKDIIHIPKPPIDLDIDEIINKVNNLSKSKK